MGKLKSMTLFMHDCDKCSKGFECSRHYRLNKLTRQLMREADELKTEFRLKNFEKFHLYYPLNPLKETKPTRMGIINIEIDEMVGKSRKEVQPIDAVLILHYKEGFTRIMIINDVRMKGE